MLCLLACLVGSLLGLLSALPGVHVSVLLIGALPLIGLGGDAGACLVTAAMASGLTATTLAKTFHPATRETLQQATPEQVMAYRGDGLKAIDIQLVGVWTGLFTTLLVVAPLLLLQTGFPKAPKLIFDNLVTPITPFIVTYFIVTTLWGAKRKFLTLLVMLAATLTGYLTLNHPSLANNEASLAPLLAGVFAIPALVQVLMHKGRIKAFPAQHPAPAPPNLGAWVGFGAISGMLTAITAGIGSGAVTSSFAGHLPEDQYLAMHTASESSNHIFAVLLFILMGMSHAGSAIALKRSTENPNVSLALLIVLCVIVGIAIATQVISRGTQTYVLCAQKIPQKLTALTVLTFTLVLIACETGLIGLAVAGVATTLALAARAHRLPNQALAAVLTGPVLIYHMGLSPILAQTLNLLR